MRHKAALGLLLAALLVIPGAASRSAATTADPVIAGAGDIACGKCTNGHQKATSDLLPGADSAFNLGDNAYPDGSLAQYRANYDPSWGRFNSMMKPIPGNHEYKTAGASGYYTYFGAIAGPAGKGYYSYDLGAWHLLAVNGELTGAARSTMLSWMRNDLAQSAATCKLAYWHKPRYSSGEHGDNLLMDDLWKTATAGGVDVVLNGHDHDYERFAPKNGVREFVVGTGGIGFRPFTHTEAGSEKKQATTWGVIKLTLHPTSYDWRFVPIASQSWTDGGTGACN